MSHTQILLPHLFLLLLQRVTPVCNFLFVWYSYMDLDPSTEVKYYQPSSLVKISWHENCVFVRLDSLYLVCFLSRIHRKRYPSTQYSFRFIARIYLISWTRPTVVESKTFCWWLFDHAYRQISHSTYNNACSFSRVKIRLNWSRHSSRACTQHEAKHKTIPTINHVTHGAILCAMRIGNARQGSGRGNSGKGKGQCGGVQGAARPRYTTGVTTGSDYVTNSPFNGRYEASLARMTSHCQAHRGVF